MFNVDPFIVCENPKVQRPRHVYLSEVPRRQTHNQKIESKSNDASKNQVVIQFILKDTYLNLTRWSQNFVITEKTMRTGFGISRFYTVTLVSCFTLFASCYIDDQFVKCLKRVQVLIHSLRITFCHGE